MDLLPVVSHSASSNMSACPCSAHLCPSRCPAALLSNRRLTPLARRRWLIPTFRHLCRDLIKTLGKLELSTPLLPQPAFDADPVAILSAPVTGSTSTVCGAPPANAHCPLAAMRTIMSLFLTHHHAPRPPTYTHTHTVCQDTLRTACKDVCASVTNLRSGIHDAGEIVAFLPDLPV